MSDRASFAGVASLTTVVALLMTVLRGGTAEPRVVVAPRDRAPAAESSPAAGDRGARATKQSAGATRALVPGRTGPELLTAFLGRSYTSMSADGSRYPLRVLVVTVPDPVDSHLDWAYDAGLEAIRRAVERAGYTLDRFWIPSPTDLDTVAAAPGQLVRPLRATRPGVLLFRANADTMPDGAERALGQAHGLILVYLVPEVPTAGVAKEALLTALRERDSLLAEIVVPVRKEGAAPSRVRAKVRAKERALVYADSAESATVRVVGPFWSGSAESLRLALEAWHAERAARRTSRGAKPPCPPARPLPVPVVDVVTGTATAPTVENFILGTSASPRSTDGSVRLRADSATGRVFSALCDVPTVPAGGPAPLCTSFRRTTNTTLAYYGAILRVAGLMGIRPQQIAVLLEMSPYGQSLAQRPLERRGARPAPGSPDDGWIRIPFPMNISYLRSEYARLGGPAGAEQQSADAQGPRASLLRVDLRDSARAMENPAVMSRDLTNASVEVQLDDIAHTLVAHRVRAVLIVATDVRDKLFMATELRRRVRDVQVMLYGTNTLLVRQERNEWLRGALVASSYPLFLESQFWDPSRADRYRTPFPNDLAEGLYNAVLVDLDASALLAEYGEPPGAAALRPPAWVSIVGAKGFLPLTIASHGSATAFRRGADTARMHGDSLAADHSPADETLFLLVPCIVAAAVLALVCRTCYSRRAASPALTESTLRRVRMAVARERLEAKRRARRLADERARAPSGSPAAPASEASPVPRLDDRRLGGEALFGRAIHQLSLTLHRHLYSGIRAIALLGLLLPAVLVPLHHRALRARPLPDREACISPYLFSHACDQVSAAVLVTLACATTLLWCAYCVVRAVRDTSGTWGVGVHYAMRGVRERTWCALSWQLEIVLRFAVGVIALIYGSASLLFFLDVWKLRHGPAMLFFERYSALDSGVSPAIPLILIAACYFVWTNWHVVRTRGLGLSTAFEEGQIVKAQRRDAARAAAEARARSEAAAAEASAARIRAPRRTPQPTASATAQFSRSTPTALVEGRSTSRFAPLTPSASGAPSPSPVPETLAEEDRIEEPETRRVELHNGVRRVRLRLFRVFPGRWGAALVMIVIGLSVWLWRRWTLSYEAAILPGLLPRGVWPLSGMHESMTAYDVLFRYGILAVLGATSLGLFRFIFVWTAFRRVLDALSETPLLGAFGRLPAPIKRLGRLTPFGAPDPRSLLEGIVADRWRTMVRLYYNHLADFENQRERPPLAMPALMRLSRPPAPYGWFDAEAPLGHPYLLLEEALGEAWLRAHSRRMDSAQGDTIAKREEAFAATPLAQWLAAAEECAATYAVGYVEWVFRHLRIMAFFILCSVVLGTVLLSSYPFQPQSLLQMLFFILLGAGVVTLVIIAVQMNRDLTLSSINGTNPNKIDFDGTFLLNMALFGVVPVFTLVSTQFPEVRNFLFSWVAPLLRALGTG